MTPSLHSDLLERVHFPDCPRRNGRRCMSIAIVLLICVLLQQMYFLVFRFHSKQFERMVGVHKVMPREDMAEASADEMPYTVGRNREQIKERKNRAITEAYVISFHRSRVEQFNVRNNHSNIQPALWVPAVDGFHQRNLDLWADLTNLYPPINASKFDKNSAEERGAYDSPHAVGCYLAHWHLLRTLRHRAPELQPELYFVFEEDASCVPNLRNLVLELVKQLPSDWDMIYIGGKPFTYFNEPFHKFNDSTKDTLWRDLCRGAFGRGQGPLAPDGTRNLSVNQPYWQTLYTTNTHAYVANPHRLGTILQVLQPTDHVPIDIRLGDAMSRGEIKVYMPTETWCDQENEGPMNRAFPWEGYFGFFPPENEQKLLDIHPALTSGYIWGEMLVNDSYCTF